MKVKKKLISWSKRLFITSVILSIVVVSGLQGSCASPTKNYIKYDNVSITSQLFKSEVSASGVSSCPMTNKDVWSNYFYSVPLFGTTSSGSFSVKIYIKDFFNNLSSDNTYHYHLTTGFTGGSTFYNLLGSTAYAYVNSQSFSVSKTSVSNGDSRFVFDFDLTGISGSSDLILQYYLSANSLYTASFLFSSYGEASYYTVVTGTDKIINQFGSNYSQPNTDNQDNFNNAESQLIGGVQSTLNGVNSQWNNLNGNLLQYQGAFMAFNRFFNNLTGIPWVGTVITLSVAIGVFALLLGAVLDYVKGTQRSNARESWKAETRRYRGKMLAESQKRRKGK